jgi:DNA (cytosine-5)-methyltransferase 1
LTSHGGKDFEFLVASLADAGYSAGALIIDAVHFLPQSRPRLFVIGLFGNRAPGETTAAAPNGCPTCLLSAHARLPAALREQWIWWNLPVPQSTPPTFESILEPDFTAAWHSPQQTAHILSLMSPLHRGKLAAAQRAGERIAGTVYRRTRHGVQRAEVRFDRIAGCLRTPAGGSSRQAVILVEGDRVRTRLLSAREAARLMGFPDSYPLPARYNDAYHLFGDGVAVPVAAWLSERLLLPLLSKEVRPASTPPVDTKYFATMHGRSHSGIAPGART